MLEKEHKAYQDVVGSLARQISMQQFYVEEISRSTGDSGLKQSRLTHTGTRSYHSTSYSGKISVNAATAIQYQRQQIVNTSSANLNLTRY